MANTAKLHKSHFNVPIYVATCYRKSKSTIWENYEQFVVLVHCETWTREKIADDHQVLPGV